MGFNLGFKGLILVTGEREGRVSTTVQRVGTLFMPATRPLIIEGHLERSVGS